MAEHDPDDGYHPSITDRARAWVAEVVDATGTTARALLAGCLLVGLGVGLLLWLTRQSAAPVESTLPLLEPSSVTTVPAPTSTAGPVVVHVAGAVVAPGVQELAPGSRVVDAVEAAGGLTEEADAARVNLAETIEDGAQIYVPAQGETPPVPVATGGEAATTSGRVDINTADGAALEDLPGIGPATAAAIIDHRQRNGPFTSVDDLLDVHGIGEAKLAQLRDLVSV